MASSNKNKNNNNNNPPQLPSETLETEILFDQNKMLRDENERLKQEIEKQKKEIENLKEKLIEKDKDVDTNTQQQQIKNEKKKEKITNLSTILGLTYDQVMECKEENITITCRKIVKAIYPTDDLRKQERVKSISPEKMNSIRAVAKLLNPKQKKTKKFILNNAIGNVFAVARI